MIINLKDSILEFIKVHELSTMDIEYVSYFSKYEDTQCNCDFTDFIELAVDINFEELDDLIKHREQLNSSIAIVADDWFITRSDQPDAIWELHRLPEMGIYMLMEEEDVISWDDNIDRDVVELLTHDSPNAAYVRDNMMILDERYTIENNDGIEQLINDKGEVAIILACNPRGQYWSQYTAVKKDPQMLFYPELIKIIMEYHNAKSGQWSVDSNIVEDGNIDTVFDLEALAVKYNLTIDGFNQKYFNNLKVMFVPKGQDYQISFTGAASYPEIRHEILTCLTSNDIIKL